MTEEKKNKSDDHKKRPDFSIVENRKAILLTTLEAIKAKKHFFYLTIFLTVLGTLFGHYLKIQTYRTTSTLLIQNMERQTTAAEYLLNQHALSLSRADRIESYLNHLKSDSFFLGIAEKVKFHPEFNKLNLTPPANKSKLGFQYWKKKYFAPEEVVSVEKKLLTPVENIARFLKQVVKYESDYSSQFIQIQTNTLEPRTSQLIANLVATEFVSLTNRHSADELKEIAAFVIDKKKESEDKVKDLDRKLIKFKQKNNIISADETTVSFANRLSQLERDIQNAKLKKKENKKVIRLLKENRSTSLKKILKDGSKAQGIDQYETATILESKIDQLKKQKSAYIAQGKNEYTWQIEKINNEIDTIITRLKEISSSEMSSQTQFNPQQTKEKIAELQEANQILQSKITTLMTARKELQSQVNLMPLLQQEFIQLENRFKWEVDNLSKLERKEKELEIQKISHKKELRVDQSAQSPGPSARGPLALKLIFSSLAAIFLGIIIVLGLENLDPSVKRRQDVYDCGLDFFGEIPFVAVNKKITKSGKFQFGSPEDLVCKNKPESIESMAFKYMRARIESMRYKESKDCQVITVSSALHNEGKSFVTSNLAISLAQLKRRTILIDADLRRPSQAAYFGLSTQYGLVDLLNMKKGLDELLVKNIYSHLDILTSGFSGMDSTELISSQKFRLFLDHLRNEYEYVIIDTPPTFAVVDAAIISSFSDIPILVSSFRSTRKADLHEAYNDLLQVSYKKVYGVINKAITSNSRIHYYGYPLYSDQIEHTISSSSTNDEEVQEFMKKLGKKSS